MIVRRAKGARNYRSSRRSRGPYVVDGRHPTLCSTKPRRWIALLGCPMIAKQCFQLVAYSLSAADDSQGRLQADVDAFGAPLTRLSRTRQGLVIETAGSSVIVGLREWPMPVANGRLHGTRIRMICPSCGALRDALHLGWGRVGLPRQKLSGSGACLSASAALVPGDPPAGEVAAQAGAGVAAGLESPIASGADCAPANGDTREPETGKSRSCQTEPALWPTSSS